MKKSSFLPVIIFLIILGSILSDEFMSSKDMEILPKDFEELYALRPTENTWPAIDSTNASLASNLLAPNYYIVLDGSGSMAGQGCSGNKSKLDAAKDALSVFASHLPGDANIGLFTFDTFGQHETLPISPGNKASFISAVQSAAAGSGTPLFSAITAAYESLKLQAKKQLGYGEYHLVVVTDGEANEGEDPRPIVKRILSESPVVLHTIGFCIGERHSLNQSGLIDYRAANDPQSLERSLEAVLAEAQNFDISEFGKTDQ